VAPVAPVAPAGPGDPLINCVEIPTDTALDTRIAMTIPATNLPVDIPAFSIAIPQPHYLIEFRKYLFVFEKAAFAAGRYRDFF